MQRNQWAVNAAIAIIVGTLTTQGAIAGEPGASLSLSKVVVGGDAVATDFELSAAGPTPISGAGTVSSGPGFAAGTYALSETGVSGYGPLGWVCTGGTQDGALITVGNGESASCEIANEICGTCEGLVSEMQLLYSGPEAEIVIVAQRGPDDIEVFNGTVTSGEQVSLLGPPGPIPGFSGTLGNQLEIFVDGELHTTIHTSCSEVLGPGFVAGDFEIITVRSKTGGLLCQDTDFDGINDFGDNCTLVHNPDQRDTDGDGYGNFCDPDLNNDGRVNFRDLEIIAAVFFGTDPDADLNGDGIVNFGDLDIVRQFFFGPPGPSALVP